jgi:hypothetical protein
MGINDNLLGASGTNMNDQEYGILKTLSGSAKAGQQAMDYARQLYPDSPEADPWEAAFQFFAEMGRAASQPGATVLGSAVGSMQVPMDYLAAKKKEKRETDRARMQTAVSLAPSLKAPVVKATYGKPDFYMVSKQNEDGTFTDPIETALTPKQFSQLPTDGTVRVTSVPKTSTSVDNTRMDVILKGVTDDLNTPIDERVTSIPRGSFDPTKHLPASALPKDSSTSEDKTRMTVILRGSADDPATQIDERIISILRSDFDETKHLPTAALPDEKSPPQGSAPERMSSRVYDFVDAYISNPEVEPRLLAQFLDDVSSMGKPQIITFVENGVTKTATNPGKDAYRIIAESYGQELADKIKALSQTQQSSIVPLSDLTDEDKAKGKPLTQTIVIAGKEYTVFSSKDPSIPKEAVQGIVDSTGGMGDIKIASDLIFPDGVFNKGLVIASNFMPGGGIGPEGSLTGDARTAYQAMKRSIELLLRARSGAAVPPAEVENYMSLYYPSSLDNESQARNKLNVLAQYFSDTNRLLSQGKLNDGEYDANKHGIPVTGSVSNAASEAPAAVTVLSEWTLDGVKYKQLSDGRIITEEAE